MKWIVGLGLLLGSIFLVYGQSLRINFSLIDDGQIVLVKRQIVDVLRQGSVSELGKILLEPAVGRVRPVYWAMQSTFAYLSQESPFGLHFIRILILILTLSLTYRFLRVARVDMATSMISVAFLAFNIQNAENYLRLGPTEPLIALLLACLLNVVVKSPLPRAWTIIGIIAMCFLALGIKETFIVTCFFWYPFSRFWSIHKSNHEFGLVASLSTLVGGAIVVLTKLSYPVVEASYASQYTVDIPLILVSLIGYVRLIWTYEPPVLLAILICSLHILRSLRPGKNYLVTRKYLILIFGFTLSIGILLPWKYVLNRYLLPANIFAVIIFSLTFNEIISKKLSRFKPLLLTISLLWFLYPNLIALANYQYFQKNDSDFTGSMLAAIAKVPPRSEVLFNYVKGDDNLEIYMETLWQLQMFFGRYDLSYQYLDDSNLCSQNDRYVFDRRSVRFMDRQKLDSQLEQVSTYLGKLTMVNPETYAKNVIWPQWDNTWDTTHTFDWTLYKQFQNTCIQI